MPEAPAPRLLVVDEALQRKALCETLRDHGYETVGAETGEAALAILRESKFDVLLTDLTMPGMDGIALLRAALATAPDLVGIIMTGQGTISTAVEAMKEGAVDYILKPFKLSVVLPVIARALTMRQLRLENAALQERVLQRTAELEAANEELDAFASSVAHDLAAPARHVTSYAHLLLDGLGSEAKPTIRHQAETIAEAGERMVRLITALLAFSRLTRKEIRRQPVDLTALAKRCRDEVLRHRQLLEPQAEKRAVEWRISPLPTLRVDEEMLQQVFINLFSNALKYTRGRTPTEIEVGCQKQESNEVTIYVRDNGVGFDMRYADRLFGMFQRLHSAGEFEGNGVGLAHVRRIVQRHGGRIWAEAEVGKGATFYFTLPA